jgi:AraC family transcriptional regulator
MEYRIVNLSPKKLIGIRQKMSLAQDKTPALWGAFMPRRNEVKNRLTEDYYSMQVYSPAFSIQHFSPQTEFEKWAAVEVEKSEEIPQGMESYELSGGLYAVFVHQGLPQAFPQTMQYIHGIWFPDSEYVLDDRPHFELLGEKYKNNDPTSEEEVWIPIKPKRAT